MKNAFLILLLFSIRCASQNTISFEEGSSSPKANLENVSWIQGHWKGEAFGGITEEIWSPPLGNSMMFSFKLVIDNQVRFYELGHIQQQGETLILQLKHFGGDLKAWEEKEEMENFKLVKIEGNRVYFDDFTFEKVSDDEINLYVVVSEENENKEVNFNYKRQ